MAPKVPDVILSDGHKMPIFGLGTWKSKPGEVTQAVKDAIDVGYRHLDCATCYENEHEVGDAIQAKIKEGVVKREDLFITSKVWNTFHRSDLVFKCLKKTLEDLRLDYVDLYLVHWPIGYKEGDDLYPKDEDGNWLFSDVDYLDTWKEVERAHKQGLAKSIGLSNFNSQQVDRILANCTIKPVINQVECHPYLNQRKLIDFCKQRGIAITGYSPLGSPDRPWAKPDDPVLLEDPKLVELGKKLGKSPAQIILRWQVQRGVIVIPKTVSKKRLIENISIFDFELEKEVMDYIDKMDCNGRACHYEWARNHKYFPFGIEF